MTGMIEGFWGGGVEIFDFGMFLGWKILVKFFRGSLI